MSGMSIHPPCCSSCCCCIRQLTREEIETMTYNPASVHEPKIADEEIFIPEVRCFVLIAALLRRMKL